jgi:hypothetical protein
MNLSEVEEMRFEDQIEVVTESGCWLWTGITIDGYGMTRRRREGGGRTYRGAHRLMWERLHGSVPPGKMVCHRCDVRCCVNPAHLFLGTAADNSADAVAKGRTSRGSNRPLAKLTEADVRTIRSRVGELQRVLAAEFGVGQTVISTILRRTAWRHV